MKTHLIIFGTDDYRNSINSLVRSAKNYFTNHHIFGPSDIDPLFLNNNINILSQKRGAGYWLWKPYFIKKILDNCDDGDIVFYVDAGNIFINDPNILFSKTNNNDGIILFDNRDGMVDGSPPPNKDWTKRDTFKLMGLDDPQHINNKHVNASYQIYKKTDKSVKFVEELLEWSQNENIITDAPNITGNNYESFKDHRHDQSILSLMSSKYNIMLEVDPSEWGNKCGLRDYPQMFIHHRNKNLII